MQTEIERIINDRNKLYFVELENYFRRQILENYKTRTQISWKRDYLGIKEYEESISNNKKRWNDILNPPELVVAGEVEV